VADDVGHAREDAHELFFADRIVVRPRRALAAAAVPGVRHADEDELAVVADIP
jgi:hypothetical protein